MNLNQDGNDNSSFIPEEVSGFNTLVPPQMISPPPQMQSLYMAPPSQPMYQNGGYYQASGFMLPAQPPMPYMMPP
jgi:hypothetical protein